MKKLTYAILLLGISFGACKKEVTPSVQLYAPDSFTPNGDGLNDYFKPTINTSCGSFGSGSFSIYSSNGNLVFETLGWDIFYEPTSDIRGWDGKINNEIFIGTYFWKINYSDTCFKNQIFTGTVNVIK